MSASSKPKDPSRTSEPSTSSSGQLVASFVHLVMLLQSLVPLKLHRLLLFLRCNQDIDLQRLAFLLPRLTTEQLERLVAFSNFVSCEHFSTDDGEYLASVAADDFLRSLSAAERYSFCCLLELHQLQRIVVHELTADQLLALTQLLPDSDDAYQFQLLQLFQQLLCQLLPEQLQSMHEQMRASTSLQEQTQLMHLIELAPEQCLLYRPLAALLRMELADIRNFHQLLPTLQPQQLMHLVRLLKTDPYEMLEIRQSLDGGDSWKGLQSLIPPKDECTKQTSEPQPSTPMFSQLALRLVEHPSERLVYRRNVKPNPAVLLTGDDRGVCAPGQHLSIVPVLLRCDDMTVLDKLIGNQPVMVSAGELATFRKLKITITSHQLFETLFILRFELRRYSSPALYECLGFVQSKPISVVSHTTQMKTPKGPKIQVSELIPNNGPANGGTRVAILGRNFPDANTLLARFDDVCVHTTLHGPATLLCTTPRHQPGQVIVQVTSDGINWSETGATFTYHPSDPHSIDQPVQLSSMDELQNSFDMSQFDSSLMPLGQSGNSFGLLPAIHQSSAAGSVTGLQCCLAAGQSVNSRDCHGHTPLHWACHSGTAETIRTLVQAAADVNVQTSSGLTALHAAVNRGFSQAVEFLLECGARPDVHNIDGQTPLHVAAVQGVIEAMEHLLQFGAMPNATDDDGDTALHWAVRGQHTDAVRLLLAFGAFVNAQNDDGETPLHLAAALADEKLVDLLLANGACAALLDESGASALTNALCFGPTAISAKLQPHTPTPKQPTVGFKFTTFHLTNLLNGSSKAGFDSMPQMPLFDSSSFGQSTIMA